MSKSPGPLELQVIVRHPTHHFADDWAGALVATEIFRTNARRAPQVLVRDVSHLHTSTFQILQEIANRSLLPRPNILPLLGVSIPRDSRRVDDFTIFTSKLDALRAEQDPDDLADNLRALFKERELYDAYVYSQMGGAQRAKVLLGVFDKVRSVIVLSRESVLSIAG